MKRQKTAIVLLVLSIVFAVSLTVLFQKNKNSNTQINKIQTDSEILNAEAEKFSDLRKNLLNIGEYKLNPESNGYLYISKIYHPELRDINRILFVGKDGGVGKIAEVDFGTMFYGDGKFYALNTNGLQSIDPNTGSVVSLSKSILKTGEKIGSIVFKENRWLYTVLDSDCFNSKDECPTKVMEYNPRIGTLTLIIEHPKRISLSDNYNPSANSVLLYLKGYADQGCEAGTVQDLDLDTKTIGPEIKYDTCTELGKASSEVLFSKYKNLSSTQEYLEIKNGIVLGPISASEASKIKSMPDGDIVYYFQHYPY